MASKDVLKPRIEEMLECLGDALEDNEVPVNRLHFMPGSELVFDDCCEGKDGEGQAWVRVLRVYPTNPFPSQDIQPINCPTAFAALIGIGVVRCAHTVNDDLSPPTPAEMSADTLKTTRDLFIVRDVLMCCYATDDDELMTLNQWQPVSTEGGCVGGEWQLIIELPWCNCPPQNNGNGGNNGD